MNLPKAKTENIVVQNLQDETLIYDLKTNQAFCLNETAAKVFNACHGAETFAELKANYQLTDDLIYFALDELKGKNLIETDYVSPFAGLSRREVIKRVGLASMIALLIVSAMIAPTAAAAASGACASICIGLGQDVCANCTGPVNFVAYPAANGGCTGPVYSSFSYVCNGTATSGPYYHKRN